MKQATPKIPIPYRQYQRAFKFVAPYWRGLLAVLVLGLFSTAVGLMQPMISAWLIDKALLRGNLQWLWRMALLMVVVTVVGFVVNACSQYFYTRLSSESLFGMRLTVYRHLQRLSPRYFARHKLGDLVSRINNDIGEVQRICGDTMLSIFSNVLFLFGSVWIMLEYNWRLTLVSVALLPVSIYTLRFYQQKLLFHTTELRQRSSNLGSFLIESIMGLRLTVTSAAEQREMDKFSWHNSQFVSSLMSMQITSFLAGALPGTVLTLATAGVFLYGGRLVIEHQHNPLMGISLGQFVAFMQYHTKLLSPVQNLLGIYTSLLTGGVSLGRVFEVLDVPVEVQDPEFPKALQPFASEVCFSNVSFRYSPNVPVLEDVSFTLRKGGLYALAGPSGVGKSTIGDLLVRLFDVQSGSVKIDGIDIREVKLSALRTMIAVVEQTPYLFHASIRENIAYGRPNASLDEIKNCAMQAGIHRFIDGLPEGYETTVGERGVTLSVGERQRIALSRALLRDPAILILDEPTSALDPGSEAIVTDELASNLRGRTTLVITHRLSLIEAADYAFVIEGGRIVEDGPPETLLGKSGYLSKHFRFKGDEILEEVSAS